MAKQKSVQIPRAPREVEGVAFSRQHGAVCPKCGFGRPRIHTTKPWEEGIRVRYHECGWCGHGFKSIETDPDWKPADPGGAGGEGGGEPGEGSREPEAAAAGG